MFAAFNAWLDVHWHNIWLLMMFCWMASSIHVMNENVRLLVQRLEKTNELLWEIKRQRDGRSNY